jgi:hypothetical protein
VGTHSAGAALLAAALLVDPLAPFRPTVALGDRDYRALDQGRAVVRDVSPSSRHIGVFGAIRINAESPRVAHWIDDIRAFKRSDAITELGRFSNPPHLEDLAALTLDAADVKTLRGCAAGKCSMLFTASEMEQLAAAAGGLPPQGREVDLLRVLREILLRRAEHYLADGRSGEPARAFVHAQWPELARTLEARPPLQVPGTSTFLYWEKMRLTGKPIITITHVTVLRDSADPNVALVSIGRHVFSTRYISDGWSVLALLPPRAERPYFIYFQQVRVDRLGGLVGRFVRGFVEREMKVRADDALIGLRNRLERGEPPVGDTEGWQ